MRHEVSDLRMVLNVGFHRLVASHFLTSSPSHFLTFKVRYSHSIVDAGFEEMSYTTRLMPRTSLTIRDEMRASRSCGRRAQSAVMPSRLSTARMAAVFS